MNTSIVAKTAGKLGGQIRLFWKANGATVSFVTGLTGSIASGVLGARGWVKAKDIIDEKEQQVSEINSKIGQEIQVSDTETKVYTEEDAKKDLTKVRKQTIIGVSKAMGPSIALGGFSAGLLTYSHMNLKGQVASIGAYATAIESQLSNYRVRVAKKIGAEEEEMLYNGVRKETIAETVVDPETGETTVKVDEVLKKDMDIPIDGVFTFEFNKDCLEWRPNRTYNLQVLSIAFSNLTDRLHVHGFVELREIYEELGIPVKDRADCQTIVDCVAKDKDSHVEYSVIDYGLDPNDPDIVFTVKTDGLILNKIKEIKKNR